MNRNPFESLEIDRDSSSKQSKYTLGRLYEDAVTCSDANMNLMELTQLMRDHHVGNVVIMNEIDGRPCPVGIITDRDLTVEAQVDPSILQQVAISDILVPSSAFALETDGVYDMIKTMKAHGVMKLPIINDHNELVGVITAKKILRLLIQELSELVNISEKQRAH